MKKILRQGVAIDKLAQKINQRSKKRGYQDGSPDEKVWINFQSTKKQKREFTEVCNAKHINASAFLRTCVEILIKSEGNVSSTVKNIREQQKDETEK
jgi:hypothetical protein